MKLMNREPTEEMLEACDYESSRNAYSFYQHLTAYWQAMFDAAPEVKVDMEPYRWIVFKDQGGLFLSNVDNENDAKYWRSHGCFVKRVYSAEQLLTTEENWNRLRASWIETNAALQAQLAERDQRIDRIVTQSGVRENDLLRRISEMGAERDRTILEQQALIDHLSTKVCWEVPAPHEALEAALKSERIKTLEDAAALLMPHMQAALYPADTLIYMANELKEQS